MDRERHNGGGDKETCSLDIVELESSDEEIYFDDPQSDHVTNHVKNLTVAKRVQKGATSSQDIFNKEDEDDIGSEEERDILKGIRDDIESKVREEMKDEIQVYQSKLQAIEDGKLPDDSNKARTDTNDNVEEKEMDPKLKEAIVKMQKLDRILRKRVKREREVKRERLLLEKKLKEEFSGMQHGASNYREIKTNTEKFLALAPPPSHNEGITLDYEEDEEMPPLFQTQIDDYEINSKSKRNVFGKDESNKENGSNNAECETPDEDSNSRAESTASGEGNRRKNSKKDFIKRNKELAAAANETIAMTDEEKKRLQDLLGDIDEMPELDESTNNGVASSVVDLALTPGDGFIPDDIELKSLTNIDEKLRYIMPEDDYASIPGTSQYSSPRPTLFTRVGIKSNLLDGFGEQVLYETKEERELKAKLDSIEKQLEVFKAPKETETGRSDNHLSDEQLDALLNQCARTISRTSSGVMDTPDSTARSEVSSRLMLMENPPKLSNEQLQQLLSEAYYPMSSRLSALSENAEESAISAEAWKAIMDERLEGDSDDNTLVDDGAESGRDSQNISQNARFNHPHSGRSFDYDNLLMSGKDEVSDRNSVNSDFRDESLPPRLRSKSKDFKGFPKISTSSRSSLKMTAGQSSSTSISENFNQGNSSSSSSFKQQEEESVDPLRLPSISSNSFLIHTSQGQTNESLSSRGTPSARDSFPTVCNNLSDMSVTSFTEESIDGRQSQNHRNSNFNSHRSSSGLVPKPPSTSHQK